MAEAASRKAGSEDLLREGAEELGLFLSGEQVQAFQQYLAELKTWSRNLNLVSRAGDREIILKDFIDSLTLHKHLPPRASLADLGSGAGFPGLPLKIARPDLEVILVEAARKKVIFLKHIIRLLQLEGIEARWTARPDEEGQTTEEFDIVASRAFGSLAKLSTAALPILKEKGLLLVMKGPKGEGELREELPRLRAMGLEPVFLERFPLPFLGHERIIIALRKNVPRGT
ncbi:MAG: 16S rRNA (guanine(527)-N(7))-methyltransferase RsmG [Deltaproteobacteria bacterium]|nr:16S rRNA (guanine(527)-N(7))-methyltransferase RsmG [Deltaproteobacteria bacterium]